MRPNFEKNLNKYNEAIKDSFKDLSKEGKVVSGQKKDEITESLAFESHTNKDAEMKIFAIQKQKLEKLNKFKKFLEKTRSSDGGFEHVNSNLEIEYFGEVYQKDGEFFVARKDGSRQSVELSEIMTDSEWGIEYAFDTSVNIHDVRAYYLQSLKSDLREKLDTQIVISEKNNSRVDTLKQNAYGEIEKRLGQENTQEGIVAEKMVKNFLKKLSIDTDVDFEIVDADVYQDVEQKIDFVIHRKSAQKNRGAKIRESEHAADIGIQFTTALGKVEQKERQIEKSKRNLDKNIDDIVLVTLPSYQASRLYKDWLKDKKPGGPDKQWSTEIKETLFRGIMDKVLSQEEITAFCQENFK